MPPAESGAGGIHTNQAACRSLLPGFPTILFYISVS